MKQTSLNYGSVGCFTAESLFLDKQPRLPVEIHLNHQRMQSGYPQRLCFLIHKQSNLRKKHNKNFMLNIVIPYGSAFLLGTSLATLFIKKILPISIIIGIITLALIYLINYLFLSKFLHFSSNLQQ